jgi:hypothetical protein
MRSPLLLGAFIGMAITGCSSGGVQVRTAVEPNADLAALHTFYVLAAPPRSVNATALSTNDPMLDNSITNRALRDDLGQAFRARGYTAATRQDADFLVAYYAGTKQKFDTTYWGPTFDPGWRYSYRGRRSWAWPYYVWPGDMGGSINVTSSTQGQVIVDVTDPRTNELVWRGQGTEPVSGEPAAYANALQGVVNAIIATFPQATAPSIAAGSR